MSGRTGGNAEAPEPLRGVAAPQTGRRRYAALLRGINVGRGNRVAMADLRGVLAGLGLTDVATLLNSGNAVFTAPEEAPENIAARIRAALRETLGLDVTVVVVERGEVEAALAANPLADPQRDPSRSLVAFLSHAADARRLASLAETDWAPESFAPGAGVAYLWCPDGVSKSPLALALGRTMGDTVTVRNVATVAKIAQLMGNI